MSTVPDPSASSQPPPSSSSSPTETTASASASTSLPLSPPGPPAPSPRRRLSHPTAPSLPLPSFPSIPLPLPTSVSTSVTSLRHALLGYLSEVEAAVRDRLIPEAQSQAQSLQPGPAPRRLSGRSDSSLPSSSSDTQDEETHELQHDVDVGSVGSSTALDPALAGQSQLRQRGTTPLRPITGAAAPIDSHHTLLQYLSTLREDLSAYLPSRLSIPTPPSVPSREWLRTLPSKLSVLDMVVPVPSTATPPVPDSAKGKGKGDSHVDVDAGAGAVEVARMKVIDMVHALLPSEEWAGWERLGWEETPSHHRGRGRAHRRAASDVARDSPALGDGGEQDGEGEDDDDEDEDEEEEPGYLFPNRTPASAQAIADRRRTIRSKSFSHPSRSTHPSNWTSTPFPARQPLTRVKTEPTTWRLAESREAHLLGAEEEAVPYLGELGEEEAKELLEHPSLADTKLTKLVAPSHLGPSVLEALETSEDGKLLITYEELPIHWRNNEHIFTGYRFIPLHTSGGPIPLIKSAFTWHNETVNIHSHFVPTVLILLAIPAIIYASPLPDAHWLDTTMLVCYLLAAVSCLFTSAGWHVLSGCASRRWFEWGACVDYIGISWLIAASFGTVVYNAYHCHPKTVLFYNTTNLFCGALGSYLPFQQWFNERKNKSWRIAFFLFLCFAMVAPMAQLFYEHGWDRASEFVSPFGLSIITYVTGLLFYGFHFPECIWPGRFDHLGASHQLWHTAIVGAILLHYRAVFVAHNARLAYSCAAHDADRPVGHVLESLIMSLIGA